MLDLAFRPDRRRPEPVRSQLEDHLRGLIASGRLAPREKLPATRELAVSLGLGRNTVAQAYEALVSDGLLTARVGQGTFVAPRAPGRTASAAPVARGFAWDGLLAARARGLRLPEPLLAPHPGRPIELDLRSGAVDPRHLPEAELRRAFSRALTRHLAASARVNDPFGHPALRAAIARSLVSRGIEADASQVLVTHGAQQAIDALVRTLVDPGEGVAIEQPGYFGASLALGSVQAQLVGIPVDAEGLRTDALERVLRARRVKLVFTTPAVQSPTGVVMSDARRAALLELADAHQTPVVEDDYDAELRLGGPPIPALKTLDRSGQVLYVGTFSKALLPGLRVGYLVAPRPVLARIALTRAVSDLGGSPLVEAALAELLDAGDLERHVRRMRKRYAARLAALDAALREHMPPGVRWSRPAGGTGCWLTLPPEADPDGVWAGCVEAGLALTRGDLFFADGSGREHLLLGVAVLEPPGLAVAVERLADVVRRALARGRRPDAERRNA